MPREFQESDESRFGGSEKDCYFLNIQKCSINLFGNTSDESWLPIFQIMLPKYVHTG